jgi:hypothetical protein
MASATVRTLSKSGLERTANSSSSSSCKSARTRSIAPREPAEGHFVSLIRFLKKKGYDVVECAFLPHSQRRVGAISAVAATIESDHFAIYRCVDEAAAEAVVAEVTHAICAGSWVLRSIPVLMYADPHYEMGQLPDEAIGWSPLLQNEAFGAALKEFVRLASSHGLVVKNEKNV